MNLRALGELPAALGAFYGGLVIGALYDLFRLLRLPFRGRFAAAVLDALYYAAALSLAAAALLWASYGQLRLYLLLGLGLGVLCYLKIASKALLSLVFFLKRLLRK